MFAHFPGKMGQDFMLVIKFNAEHGAWKNSGNGAFEFNRFFAAHEGYGGVLKAIHVVAASGDSPFPTKTV